MKLKKKDAAIIFHEDGSISVEMPKTDPVPDHVLKATIIAIMLTQENKSFERLMNKQYKEFCTLVDDLKAEVEND